MNLIPTLNAGGPMLRWTARMRFRSALLVYLMTGSDGDRRRMLDRAAGLRSLGEESCRISISLAALGAERDRRTA